MPSSGKHWLLATLGTIRRQHGLDATASLPGGFSRPSMNPVAPATIAFLIGDAYAFSKPPAKEPTSDRTLAGISATTATHFTHSTRIVGSLPVLQKNLPKRN